MFSNRSNNYDDYYGPGTPGMEYSRSMSTASVILAVVSVFSSLMFYIALPTGALSILLALLSRGRNRQVPGKCRIAIMVSVIGITASIVTTAMAVYTVMTDPEMRSQLESTFNYYAQELGLDGEFGDYFGGGQEEEDDGEEDSIPDDDDRANDYFNRFYGNDGSTPDNGGNDALPDDGSSIPPDDDDTFSYWYNFNGSEPGGGGQAEPSGGEYI